MSTPRNTIDTAVAHHLLRDCHTRQLDREGIPMVLALVDERGTMPQGTDQSRTEGTQYADLLGVYAELVVPAPAFRATDEGGLITAMQILAYAHFDESRSDKSKNEHSDSMQSIESGHEHAADSHPREGRASAEGSR